MRRFKKLPLDFFDEGNLLNDDEWSRLSVVMPNGALDCELIAATIGAACPDLTIGRFGPAGFEDSATPFGENRAVILLGVTPHPEPARVAQREILRRLRTDGHTIVAVVAPPGRAEQFLADDEVRQLKIRCYCWPDLPSMGREVCHLDGRPTPVTTVAAILGDRLTDAACHGLSRIAFYDGGMVYDDGTHDKPDSIQRDNGSEDAGADLITDNEWERLSVVIPYNAPLAAVLATSIHAVCPHLTVGVIGPKGLLETDYAFGSERSVILLGWSLDPNRELYGEERAVSALRDQEHRILAVIDREAGQLARTLLSGEEVARLRVNGCIRPQVGARCEEICDRAGTMTTYITSVAAILGSRFSKAAIPALVDAALCESGLINRSGDIFRKERDRLLPPDPTMWVTLIKRVARGGLVFSARLIEMRRGIAQKRRERLERTWSDALHEGDGLFRILAVHAGFCDSDDRMSRHLVREEIAPPEVVAVIVPSLHGPVEIRLIRERAPGISMVNVVKDTFGFEYQNVLGPRWTYWARDDAARVREEHAEAVIISLRNALRLIAPPPV